MSIPKEPWTTAYLADRPDLIPILAGWFSRVWTPYYGADGPGDAVADLAACDQRDGVPLCLVALDGAGAPVGTAALKARSVASPAHLTPWLAALTAAPYCDCPSLDVFLTAAIEGEARRLGYAALYTGWEPGAALLLDRGWVVIEQAQSLRGAMSLYRLDLATDHPRSAVR